MNKQCKFGLPFIGANEISVTRIFSHVLEQPIAVPVSFLSPGRTFNKGVAQSWPHFAECSPVWDRKEFDAREEQF